MNHLEQPRSVKALSSALLLAALVIFQSQWAFSKPIRPEKPPNVLLICIDDLRPELGCYGAEHMQTPNIDRLAASGVTFDRCYVQVAVCNPSRASVWTGMRPDRLNVYTLRVHFRETVPDAITLFQHLSSENYHCEGMGKIFHNPWQDPQSWDAPHVWGNGSFTHYTPQQRAFRQKVAEELPNDSWQKGNLRGIIATSPDIPDEAHSDASMASKAVDRLRDLKQSDKPFLLAVGFVLPHLPWAPPKRWWDHYQRDQLPLADNPQPPAGAPKVAVGTNFELSHYADLVDMPTPFSGSLDEAETRRLRHAYFASVSFIDAQVGKLLDSLDENGLSDNTVVVLWSDHGYKLGEHNGWAKMTNYEIDTRIPFIIRAPGASANGQRCNQLVESLDLYPTICELAGVPTPDNVDGKSLAPLLSNSELPHRDAAFSQYVRNGLIGNAIRTDRWRYVEWRRMKDGTLEHTELYDHDVDPQENTNVVADYPEEANRLGERMRESLDSGPVDLVAKVRSQQGGNRQSFQWVNRHDGPVRITWINGRGERKMAIELKPGEKRDFNSFTGHVFAIESLDGSLFEYRSVKGDQDMTVGKTN